MFYIAQAGTALKLLDEDGVIVQTLTLPSGVTIDSTKRGRWAILGQQILFVNAATVNLWIDPFDFTVRPMSIQAPSGAPTLSAGAGSGLSGVYRVKIAFAIKDENGVVLNETRLGPASGPVTLTNDTLKIENLPISTDDNVNCRRIYRTTAGGADYFLMLDIDDNVSTETETAISDASLELLPEDPELGNPPGAVPGTSMELITEWRNRLWGKSGSLADADEIKFSDFDKFYAWARTNFLLAQPVGEDEHGITAYAKRRDELVVMKRRRILKVTGFSEDDFAVIVVAEGVGCIAPDSAIVVRDVVYFLGPDGVYEYGPNGVRLISGDHVTPWFQSDTYFNRDLFGDAQASYNPLTDCYELQLSAAGSTNMDRWVAYDIRRKEWLGPHLTSKFTPTCRTLLTEASGVGLPVIAGSNGVIYKQNQSGASDAGTAIAISWQSKPYAGQSPTTEKFWQKPIIHLKKQGYAAGPITVTPQVGDYGAPASDPLYCTQQEDQVELDRPGEGRVLQLTFEHNINAEDVDLRGFELPFAVIGQRPNPR